MDKELSQAEMIDAIVDGVFKKLEDRIDRYANLSQKGVLVGSFEIGRYMGLTVRNRFQSSVTLKRWRDKLGFPMNKYTVSNKWWITKSLIDKWMYERHILMLKLRELGYYTTSRRGKRGYSYNNAPERHKPEEIAHARREILKDRLRSRMAGEDGGVRKDKEEERGVYYERNEREKRKK